MKNKLLSIAIPTFNRSEWLKICLTQLLPQVEKYAFEVEVVIYDNASPDNTKEIVSLFNRYKDFLTYHRNSENIGSDRNIAQCFNRAKGNYVLILGDDDVLLDGSLDCIVEAIRSANCGYGAIYIKAYGYDDDFIKERPLKL
jgi:abequosyltransferase